MVLSILETKFGTNHFVKVYQLTLTRGSGLSLCLVETLSGSKRFFLNNHPIRQE